jgi:ketosteroid isomerase-like protein
MNAAIQAIVDRWIEAERNNDAHPLEGTITDDFRFVGPAGFVLTRDQFLGRFDTGDLKTTSFDITDLELREHDNVAIAIGVWTQETTFQARPNNGNFRLTMVFTGSGDQRQVLGAQLSPMMAPV